MHNKDWEILIESYLQGKCTPEEKELVEQYYQLMDNNVAEFFNADADKINESARRSLTAVKHKIAKLQPHEIHLPKKNLKARLASPMRIAAAVLVFITATTLIYRQLHTPANTIYKEITAATGHILQITLADSSTVVLNAGSTLKYPQNSTNATRDVYLTGEAFFDVKHDVKHPFVVHTAKLTTTVLGTAFSVSAYANAGNNAVTVARGKVQVAHEQTVLALVTPGKQISYNLATGASHLANVDAGSFTAWTTGKLQFNDQSLVEITQQLNRWYGYSFYFANSKLQNCRYTASFKSSIQLNRLLHILTGFGNTKYRINHQTKTVTLSGSGCN